jgi:ADP-heptose:LPS heptosyltransferase
MVCNLPWVQSVGSNSQELLTLAQEIRNREFDAVFIFTVYSQSALPAAMLAYMAGIPVRVAYARENPYQLLTNWIPDLEPYEIIQHQVTRDLALVSSMGAQVADDRFRLNVSGETRAACGQIMRELGINISQPYLVIHPGVSEKKREYPAEYWVQTGKLLMNAYKVPLLVSGGAGEKELGDSIAAQIGQSAVSIASKLSLGEFIHFIEKASAVVAVNTGTIHIAAATQTPIVVLYAQTNPQHTPWKCKHRIIEYSVPEALRSKNAIIKHVNDKLYAKDIPFPAPAQILSELDSLIQSEKKMDY